MKLALALLLAVLLLPAAAADTFLEDFESFDAIFDTTVEPDQDWYDYSEGADIGRVSLEEPELFDAQWFAARAGTSSDESARYAHFTMEVPAQLIETTFYLNGTPYATNGQGSQQVVRIESSAPARTMVEFFVLCSDHFNDTGCEFRVRWEHTDTTGLALIDADANTTQFKVRVVPNWIDSNYRLYVNDVDDGTFPFLEIPKDIGRISILQHREDVPLNVSFDNWEVQGAQNGTSSAVEGDIATGLKNFANDIRFRTAGSKFFFGFLVFIILCAAVIVPLLTLGRDNTVIPSTGFFVILAALWMVYMEWWPDWLGISMIILVAALVGAVVRRLVLGISDASRGPGLVAGSLGYFIIATSLLAFSGYATETVAVPSAPVEQTADASGNIPADQSFVGAVTECVFTLFSNCDQSTQTTTWKKITDALGWARAALDFLFQLLSFSLPIPVIFNVIIVLPPASALATFAVQTIRGSS